MRKSKTRREGKKTMKLVLVGLQGPYYKWCVRLLFVKKLSIFRRCLILGVAQNGKTSIFF